VFELDVRIFRWLHESISDTRWLAVMCVLTVLGSGWGSFMLVPLYLAKRTRRFAAILTAVLLVNAVIIFLVKVVVRRPRPFLVLPDVRALVFEAPTGYSFPSGHSAGSFSLAMFAAIVLFRGREFRKHPILRGGFAVFLLVAAGGVALSRVALGVHFPIDIAVGAIVGSTVGGFGARYYLRTGRPTEPLK